MKTVNLPFNMTSRGKHLAATSFLVLVMKVFSGHTLTCDPSEYQIGTECCPMCNPGTRVETDCTEFRPTSCLSCTEGTFMNKPTGRRECFSCAKCDAGSGLKIKSSCTTTSDSICEPLEGFYCMDSTENGCRAAQRHTRCQPGQYISQKGTASTDTVCSDCNDGTFSNGTFTSCRPHTQCEAQGLLLITAGTASTDAECGESSLNLTAVIVVLVFVFLSVGISVTVYYFRKKKRRQTNLRDRNGREPVPTKEPGEETAMETLRPSTG